ncbi:MAG: S8 family serine peptidase [Bacteroidales bacterium]
MATKSLDFNEAADALGVVSIERLFPDAGEFEPRTRAEGLHKWYVVHYDESVAVTKAETSLKDVPGVETVDVVPRLKLEGFNDPLLSKQWNYRNDGSLGSSYKAGIDINVQTIWDKYTTGSPKVIVGVVDSGADSEHPDLKGVCIGAGANGSYNFVDKNYTIVPGSHGTHVAGTIAAINDNGVGCCGIAGGDAAKGVSGVRILNCQIFEDKRGGSASEGIKWAADHGAVIVNNSWCVSYDSNGDGKLDDTEMQYALAGKVSAYTKEAIDYFIKYAGCDNEGNQLPDSPMKGGLVVFSAGNDGIANGVPGNYEPVIAVGSVTAAGAKSSFSNYGDWVDISAPGSQIYSTTVNNTYVLMSGTSMSCPHVTGVAALLVSYYGAQGFTASALKEKLIKGANYDKVPSSAKIGGLLDALGAMTYGSGDTPAVVSGFNSSVKSNEVTMTWKVTANSKNVKAEGYMLVFAKSKAAFDSFNPREVSSEFKTVRVATPETVAEGENMSGTMTGLDFSQKYYVAIVGYDYGMNYSDLSEIKEVVTLENKAPVITLSPDELSLLSHLAGTFDITVSEPNGHSYTVTYKQASSSAEAEVFKKVDSNGKYSLSVNARLLNPGTYSGTITATDAFGLSSTKAVKFTVLENHAPEVVKAFDNILSYKVGDSFVYNADDYFKDPDGETLTYSTVMDNSGIVYLDQSGNTLYGSTLGYGMTTVTITGTDVRGLTCSSDFKVLVRESEAPVQAYPNPVVKTLNIRTGKTESETSVKITSSTGAVVYEGSSQCSAFNPMAIDLSALAPGRYRLEVDYDESTFIQKIIKI